MLWVGGGIVLHGLEHYGWSTVAHGIHDVAHAAGQALGGLGAAATWLVSAAASGAVGLVLGGLIVPLARRATPAAAH